MSGIKRRVLDEKVVLTWRCDHCDTKVSGLERTCPNCGMPRDRGTKFDTNDIIGTLSAEESKRYGQPDWLCESCDTLNNYKNTVCESCGAPKGSSKNYFEMHEEIQRRELEKSLRDSGGLPPIDERPVYTETSGYAQPAVFGPRRKHNSAIIKKIAIAAGSVVSIALFVWLLVFVFSSKDYNVVVDKIAWERRISIEEMHTYHEEGWTLPAGARQTDVEWKYKDKKRVIDHYENVTKVLTKSETVEDGYDVSYETIDNGDGTGSVVEVKTPKYKTIYYDIEEVVQEPVYVWVDVYDWYYYYDVDKWEWSRSIDTGCENNQPYWGDVTLSSKERVGTKYESYYIYVTGEEFVSRKFEIDEGSWSGISKGDQLLIRVNRLGGCKVIAITFEAVE